MQKKRMKINGTPAIKLSVQTAWNGHVIAQCMQQWHIRKGCAELYPIIYPLTRSVIRGIRHTFENI